MHSLDITRTTVAQDRAATGADGTAKVIEFLGSPPAWNPDCPFSPPPFVISTFDEAIEAAMQLMRLGFDVTPPGGWPKKHPGRPQERTNEGDDALIAAATAAIRTAGPGAKLNVIATALKPRFLGKSGKTIENRLRAAWLALEYRSWIEFREAALV